MRCSSSLFHLATIALVAVAVFSLQTATAPANATSATHPSAAPAQPALDFGDAPEGVLAYSTGAIGRFPTCMFVGPAAWVRHGFGGLQMAWFGPGVDYEPDGNGGFCPLFQPNDRDECFADGDAGLLMPQPFTLLGGIERPCPTPREPRSGLPVNRPSGAAMWTSMSVTPCSSPATSTCSSTGEQNGAWGQAAQCPPGAAPEHVLTNFVLPPGFAGPLSALGPPSFLIGPQPGFAWARFAITEQPVPVGWDGAGQFDAGESEDYLLLIAPAQPDEYDWGDAPDPLYPTLSASGGAAHVLTANGPVLGNRVDAEPDGQPDATATGDDLSNTADEDGVVFMTPLLRGQQACVSVLVKPAGPGGLLDAWVDFDLSGVWGDFGGEQDLRRPVFDAGPPRGALLPGPAERLPRPHVRAFPPQHERRALAPRPRGRWRSRGLPGDGRGAQVEPAAGLQHGVPISVLFLGLGRAVDLRRRTDRGG